MATGAGVCLAGVSGWTGTSPTATYQYLYASATVTTAADFTAFQAAGKGGILTCWNPSTGLQITASPAIGVSNAILACMVDSTFFLLVVDFFLFIDIL